MLALVQAFIDTDGVATVQPATIGRPAVFSTEELLRQERVGLKLATNSRTRPVPVVSEATVEQVVRERTASLNREQAAMIRAVAGSRDPVICVVGHAGSGKTTALAALADAFERDGHLAIGAAPSGVAAAHLAAETGLACGTLHRLLREAHHLPRQCLVIVDEAGMADSRTLTRLLLRIEAAQARAVLVGDPAQLGAVGPGGLYQAIVERKGAIELSENHRQRDQLERQALALLREGRSIAYLSHAAEQGRLAVADTRTEAKARLVADWWQAADADLAGSVMIAYRRSDVDELNAVARTLLQQQGRLGDDPLRLENRLELAVGERILCTRNDRRLEIANGSRGTIVDVDREERAIVVDLDDRRRVTMPARYLDGCHVSHGYALTGHKTQGLTVERAFVLADDQRALKEWGYVALTRARAQTRLYTIAEEFEPDASPHRLEPDEPLNRLADALSRPAAETLALDALRAGRSLSDRERLALESRNLHDRQRALTKERTDLTSELQRTRQELRGMGAIGRARRRRTLREEIAEREREVARLDRELEQLTEQRRLNRTRTRELVRITPRPERRLGHEPDLEPAGGRDRGFEIEL